MSLFNDYFKAVYVALDATTGLTGIISESLSNADPFPKIWIEDGGADDWSNKDDNGLEAFVLLLVCRDASRAVDCELKAMQS